MTEVRIYRPATNPMQSGPAKGRGWVLEFEPGAAKRIDPLMGWVGSPDTRGQVRLTFEGKDEAVAFAERNGLTYRLREPKTRRIRPKSYAANFRPERIL